MNGEERSEFEFLKTKYQLHGQSGLDKDEWKRYSRLRFEEREKNRYERHIKEAPRIAMENEIQEAKEKRRREWSKTIVGVLLTFLFIYLLAYRLAGETPKSVSLERCLSRATSEQEKFYCHDYFEQANQQEQTYPW